jgi:site-specific DNA-methyltransferase (adenine-specific)
MDLMGLSVRLAGFEIRDSIGTALMAWTYGSGMPKGQNIGKAIDKHGQGQMRRAKLLHFIAQRQVDAQWLIERGVANAKSFTDWTVEDHAPSDKNWVLIRDALGVTPDEEAAFERSVIRTRTRKATGRMLQGEGGYAYGEEFADTAPATPEAAQWEGWNTSLRPSWEPIIVARRPFSGTVAANVMEHGTGALNIGATRVATSDNLNGGGYSPGGNKSDLPGADRTASAAGMFAVGGGRLPGQFVQPTGRWPANVVLVHSPLCAESGCEDSCPVAEMDRQSGTSKSPSGPVSGPRTHGGVMGRRIEGELRQSNSGHGDEGGASRYFPTFKFPTFKYQAKAPSRERPRVNGVAHPTTKPLALMRWLAKLVTPPGGTILEPFAGSGTTVEAAILEGFNVIAVEREHDYLPLIEQRIERAHQAIAERVEAAEKAKRPTPARTKPKRTPTPSPALDPLGQDMLPFEVA